MIRFSELERLGLRVAAMSDRSDGDCRAHDPAGEAGRVRFCRACEVEPSDLILPQQVHGSKVTSVSEGDCGRGSALGKPPVAETDALITDVTGLPIAVTVADCVPVFLFEPRRKAAGIIHAGRVGTFHNVSGRVVEALCHAYDADPSLMHAVIGPSAGPDAYEVSLEMAHEFAEAGLPVRGRCLDLWEANTCQLVAAGVPRSQVTVSGICTISDGRFHSHRAHANGMRNLALVTI